MKFCFLFQHILLICVVYSYIIYQRIPKKKRFFFYDLIYGFKPKLSKSAVRLAHGSDLNKVIEKQKQKRQDEHLKRMRKYRSEKHRKYSYSYRSRYRRYRTRRWKRRRRYRYIRRHKFRRRRFRRKFANTDNPYRSMKDVTMRDTRERHHKVRNGTGRERQQRYPTFHADDSYGNWKSDQVGLSEREKYLLVKAHNRIRRNVEPPSSNMRVIDWDDKLADIAQRYAEKCIGMHNRNRTSNQSKFTNVGENIYYSWSWHIDLYTGERITAPLDVERAVQQWDNEKFDFDFSKPRRCICGCGHYKQAVRDVSYALGCGTAFCPTVKYKRFSRAHILVCNYGEGYNPRSTPYKAGVPCSGCDPKFPECRNGLCSKNH